MPQFQHIEFLFILLLVPVFVALYFYLLRWKKQSALRLGDARLIEQLTRHHSPKKFRIKFLLFISSFILLVMALANPRSSSASTLVKHSGVDIMIALDVSKSMLARDVLPNRLERAKQFLNRLIDQLIDDRIGIVIFAGRAYLQMPLTSDHNAAKMYLSAASTETVATQGTVIADALKMCYAGFNTKEKKYKSVVMLTDGEDHDDNALKMAQALADEGVMINTIGIGSPEGSLIVDPQTNEIKTDENGNKVVSKLNDEELKKMASVSNGIYQPFSTADEMVRAIERQLASMGQHTVKETSTANYQNYFQFFLMAALVLLGLDFFISENKNIDKIRGLVTTHKPLLLLMFLFFTQNILLAQTANNLINKGNETYGKKDYQSAANQYRKAIRLNPKNDKAHFNLGNALYKSGNADSAVQSFEQAIQNSPTDSLKAAAWYNKGVVQQTNKKLPDCIESYKKVLRLNPTDDDARHNLQVALQQQKQDQQQQKKNNKKDPQQKKDDQKKEDKKQPESKQDKNQPKPQPSKMSKAEAEEKLKSLSQHEKELQDKLRKGSAAPSKPEKDW